MLDWSIGLGYDGFMWDFGEYVQVDVLASDGTTGEQLHNLYPVLYDRAGHEHLEAGPKKGDWMFFARSGYTGSSRWAPMVWSGDPAASFEDSDGLPSMVRAAVNMGVSGAPNWGGDIGGFHCFADGAGAADGELLARWIQQGAMTPNMQDQNACSFAQDGKKKASIWTAPEAKAAWKTYARLHTRLLPYFWALARRAHEHGEPIVRHLFFEHPDRADLRAVDDTYYLGPALLVAPVVHRGERSRSVKLPQGLWLDWHDGVLLAGGEERALEAPLDKLPLLLRDGYLVPLLDPRIDTLAPEASAEIVGPGDVADVYDVVGLLSRGKRGAFALEDGGTLEAEHAGAFAAPALEEAKAGPDLASCAGCWRADPMGAGLRRVRVSHGGGDLAAGGLMLRAHAGRRVRWDLYLAEP
jgi:alpha-glucosidase (family GH31 glycosyl hydrolase)